jgi:cytochrome c peroxidase
MIGALLLLGWLSACREGGQNVIPDGRDPDLVQLPYAPSPYDLEIPPGFPQMVIPADNPLTLQGVALGRRLFYDPILSADSTISCSSCHQLEQAFNDRLPLAVGIGNQVGPRSSMSLLNIGFNENGFFWDGRVRTLEEQALHPVTNPVEMGDIWEHVEEKLRRHPTYPAYFREAFGIDARAQLTRSLVSKALAQFERTLVSANSRYDQKFYQGNDDPFLLSDLEIDGYNIFFDDLTNTSKGGHCAHCHGGPLLTNNDYFNNAIQAVNSLDDFQDKGLGAITGRRTDNGKFRAPSLRNIALGAPYMHNGRFQTLEEVVDHYSSGGHWAENVNVQSINHLSLNDYEKKALTAFLHTFTDTTFYTREEFRSPFPE